MEELEIRRMTDDNGTIWQKLSKLPSLRSQSPNSSCGSGYLMLDSKMELSCSRRTIPSLEINLSENTVNL